MFVQGPYDHVCHFGVVRVKVEDIPHDVDQTFIRKLLQSQQKLRIIKIEVCMFLGIQLIQHGTQSLGALKVLYTLLPADMFIATSMGSIQPQQLHKSYPFA